MSASEQQELKESAYNEALRYMENAKEQLIKADKENNYYKDKKYVQSACGIAYNAVLIALNAYIKIKGITAKPKEKKDIEFYQRTLNSIDKKLLKYVSDVYEIIHKDGYYDGITNAKVLTIGFDSAFTIINKIRPYAV